MTGFIICQVKIVKSLSCNFVSGGCIFGLNIYIYVCVCVFVCVCIYMRQEI